MMKTHCHLCLVDGACAQYGHEATLTTSSQHIDKRPDVILLYDSIGLQAYRASAKHTICVFFLEQQSVHEIVAYCLLSKVGGPPKNIYCRLNVWEDGDGITHVWGEDNGNVSFPFCINS